MAEEVATALGATDKDVEIGGAGLAAAAIELGLVDELRIFRIPIVVGGGTPFLPPSPQNIPLDLIETRTFDPHVIYASTPADAAGLTIAQSNALSARLMSSTLPGERGRA